VVTLSIGIAFGRDCVGPERVAKWADDALYEAKHAGRNRVMLAKAELVGAPSVIPALPSDLVVRP
jgi:pyrrolidone-carboxylate peptidase